MTRGPLNQSHTVPRFRDRILALLEKPPPAGMSHWDRPAVAETLSSSVYAVWRILRREGIYMQRLRSWCVSTDKEFTPKAAEVVYLHPPLNAVVLSVDENPGMQAIERPSGYVETDSGTDVRALKSTYKRHGTLNLFAALEVGTGKVQATSRSPVLPPAQPADSPGPSASELPLPRFAPRMQYPTTQPMRCSHRIKRPADLQKVHSEAAVSTRSTAGLAGPGMRIAPSTAKL